MKTNVRCARALLLGGVVLVLSGCTLGLRSFTIVDLPTGEKVRVGRRSAHRELVLQTDERTASFCTLYADKRDRLFSRTIGYDGKVIQTRPVLGLPKQYATLYHVQKGYALSPDGDSMAYLDLSNGEFRISRMTSLAARTIATNLPQSLAGIRTVRWLSETDLLLVAGAVGVPGVDIFVLDSRDGTRKLYIHHQDVLLPAGVETDGRYLSFYDESTQPSGLVVYDLREHQQVGSISPVEGGRIGYEHWAEEGKSRLLYIETGRQHVLTLKEYDPDTGASKELKRWERAGKIFICGYYGTRLFYTLEPPSPPTKQRPDAKLLVYDAAVGRESEVPKVGTRGHIWIIAGAQRVICEHWP